MLTTRGAAVDAEAPEATAVAVGRAIPPEPPVEAPGSLTAKPSAVAHLMRSTSRTILGWGDRAIHYSPW